MAISTLWLRSLPGARAAPHPLRAYFRGETPPRGGPRWPAAQSERKRGTRPGFSSPRATQRASWLCCRNRGNSCGAPLTGSPFPLSSPPGSAEPAQRVVHVGFRLHLHLDPALAGEPAMRPHAGLAQGAGLVLGAEVDPEVVVLRAQRKAGEQALADEVTPAPEHRRDAHAVPAAEGDVQRAGGAGAAAGE